MEENIFMTILMGQPGLLVSMSGGRVQKKLLKKHYRNVHLGTYPYLKKKIYKNICLGIASQVIKMFQKYDIYFLKFKF